MEGEPGGQVADHGGKTHRVGGETEPEREEEEPQVHVGCKVAQDPVGPALPPGQVLPGTR